MPDVSIGEIDSLVYKAYRGAGFSWGMAQEAGRAAAWLAAHGLPAAALFVGLLEQIDAVAATDLTPVLESNRLHTAGKICCPVVSGTALSDIGAMGFDLNNENGMAIGTHYSPVIVLPFIANMAIADNVDLTLVIDSVPVLIAANGVCSCDALASEQILIAQGTLSLSIAPAPHELAKSAPAKRALVSPADLQTLEQLAHRTYVPATDASRSSGAGAGLTDND